MLSRCVLQETLNIQDAPMMAMPMGGMAAAATPVVRFMARGK